MNFLTAETISEPTPSAACFLMWHRRHRLLKSVHPQQPIPYELLPEPNQIWPDQLEPQIALEIQMLLSANHITTTTLKLRDASWKITVSPTDTDHAILFAEPLQANQNPQGLAVIELNKAVTQLSGVEKNQRILELLQYYSHCDRILIWQLDGQAISPLYLSSHEIKPGNQPLDKRYLRAIESRKQLSFSDLYHQPMLAGQEYFKPAGILARLDQAILMHQKIFGIMTLEYRQIQDNFSDETRAIAHEAATLLMMDKLPASGQSPPWILTDDGSDI